MIHDLSRDQRDIVGRISELARGQFAGRADRYDRDAAFPREDFDDLFRAGLHAPAVPRMYGGLGLGPADGLLALWSMTRTLATANMSLARCWEGHLNSQVLLAAMADESQKARWFEGIVARGEIWAAWSGEPRSRVPGQTAEFGTTLRKVAGGYEVEGTKAFATSATGARWAILLVNAHGPGGARHASASTTDGLLLLACDLSDPGVSFDPSWWDPIGMRATVSHVARFDRTFIPGENLIGQPGQYFRDQWQSCFSPHYGATFLGGAEAAYSYALNYVGVQGKADDPYVQHHVGAMGMNLESAHLWLRNVAGLWQEGRVAEARSAGNRVRYLVEQWALETVDRAVRTCGARALIRPSPLERIHRDLQFYVRHDNADNVLATIGRELLGRPHDGSFFRPIREPQGAKPAPGEDVSCDLPESLPSSASGDWRSAISGSTSPTAD
jgi:alkylation response protein AidB-like acyl-CoA dehydrogenase